MKKTFIYSLVLATFLVGCGDKESGSIAESVKSVANGAVEKTKEVTKEAVSDTASKTVEKAKEVASSVVDSAKEAGSKTVEKAKEVASDVATATTSAVASATEVTKEVASEAAEKVNHVVESATDSGAGKVAFAKCVACHGPFGAKKALGASKVIAGWDASKTEAALKGYKDGSYGGAMKGVMKGQVVSMSDEDIASVAAYISTLK